MLRALECEGFVKVAFAQVHVTALENYRIIVDLIEVLIIINGTAKYTILVNELNPLIDDYNQVIKQSLQGL